MTDVNQTSSRSQGVGFLGVSTTLQTNTNQYKYENQKTNKLVKTDKQAESAYIVFWSIAVGGILLAVTIIAEYL